VSNPATVRAILGPNTRRTKRSDLHEQFVLLLFEFNKCRPAIVAVPQRAARGACRSAHPARSGHRRRARPLRRGVHPPRRLREARRGARPALADRGVISGMSERHHGKTGTGQCSISAGGAQVPCLGRAHKQQCLRRHSVRDTPLRRDRAVAARIVPLRNARAHESGDPSATAWAERASRRCSPLGCGLERRCPRGRRRNMQRATPPQ